MRFDEFDFSYELLDGLDAMGFEKATPIQEQAIPIIMDGKDIIACAQTGTGKTAAFLLPILDRITRSGKKGKVNTLVIAPTRELALQIDQQVEGFSYFLGVTSLAVYGGGDGMSWEQQKKALTKGADLIIATPGRLLSHLGLGYVKFDDIEHLILDEADRMLDMGFFEDIMSIVGNLPKERQNLLFSATMPPKIRTLAKQILNKPEQINIAMSKPAAGVLQAAYLVYDDYKTALLKDLIKDNQDAYHSIIVFASTKKLVSQIGRELQRAGISAKPISSDLEQKERENVLLSFRNRETQVLVATDIMARGIDIKEINLVVNYDVPNDAEDYVHRVGRTARADSTGVALTFINEKGQRKFFDIETLIEQEIAKIKTPENIGNSPAYEPQKRCSGGRGGNSRGGSRGRSGSGGRSGGGRGRQGGSKNKGRNSSGSSKNRNSGKRW